VNREVAEKIEKVCGEKNVDVVGKIPYDSAIVEQISTLKFPFKGEAADAIGEVWENLKKVFE